MLRRAQVSWSVPVRLLVSSLRSISLNSPLHSLLVVLFHSVSSFPLSENDLVFAALCSINYRAPSSCRASFVPKNVGAICVPLNRKIRRWWLNHAAVRHWPHQTHTDTFFHLGVWLPVFAKQLCFDCCPSTDHLYIVVLHSCYLFLSFSCHWTTPLFDCLSRSYFDCLR